MHAIGQLTGPASGVRASISIHFASRLSRQGDFTMTAARSSLTRYARGLTSPHSRLISGPDSGLIITTHPDLPAGARRRPARPIRGGITLLCAAVLVSWGHPTWGQVAPQPVTQDATLITQNGTPITGSTFSNWVDAALTKGGNPNAASAAFYFQQCYGGGVLDDLTNALNGSKVNWAGGAASTYSQPSVGQAATPTENAPPGVTWPAQYVSNNPQDFWTNALYNSITNNNTVLQQVTAARNNDLVGINGKAPYGPFETGQTYSSPNGGANVTLGGNGVSHVAILWGGNANSVRHFNDTANMFTLLTRLWGNNGKVEVLFGNGKTNSVGAPLPAAWNAQAATSANLQADIAGLNLNANTQFVFYATDHGGWERTLGDWPKILPGGGQNVQVCSLTGSDLTAMLLSSSTPTLTVDYSGLTSSSVSVQFDGFTLGTLNPSATETVFTIPLADLSSSNSVIIDNSGSGSFTLTDETFFTGGINNNPPIGLAGVPEPSTWMLLVIGCGIAALARCRALWARRRRTRPGAATVAGCLAFAVALAMASTTRAGSVRLTMENPESWLRSVGSDEARTIAELDRAGDCFKRGEFDVCLKQLGQAVQAHPELPPARVLFAGLAFQSRQISLIRPALEQAALEAPEHPEVFILFGDLALLERRLTDAAVHYEKARALATAGRWPASHKDRFARFCREGETTLAENRGDWKAARAALEDRLKDEPGNALARQRLGKALFQLGQQEAAYQALKGASEADSTLEPAAITMGWLYTRAGDLAKAREWMDYAVKVDAHSHAIHVGLGAWLLEQGRGDEAQAQAEAALQLDPKSDQARRLLGLAARLRKDLARAQTTFDALVQGSPQDVWLRGQLAQVLAEQADAAKRRRALELAEQTVRHAPAASEAVATLGAVYYHLHRLDEAETVLQAVVASGQGSSDTAYLLARVKADRGHADAAQALIKSALAAPGLFIARTDARRWLDQQKPTSNPGS
jgi:tetratricopeptide (TPR) repeat protein